MSASTSGSNNDPNQQQLLKQLGEIGNNLEIQEKLQHLVAKVGELEAQNKALLNRGGYYRSLVNQVIAAVVANEPYQRVAYKIGSNASESKVAAVIDASDWHIGEMISVEETEGFGAFNWNIAQKRVSTLIALFLDWIRIQRTMYRIDELWIIAKGDFVSGDIHQELLVTNEFPLPVQTAKAGQLFSEFVAQLAAHFSAVHIIEQGADNHGRLVRKPQAKQKASNNMSYLVYEIANAYLAKHGNIEIIRPAGMKSVEVIAKHKFLIEHGDTVKAWAGIPYYGMERTRSREAIKRMGHPEKEFDYWSIGHWHVPTAWLSGNIFINGSLSGTSEFDHSQGRHAHPAQMSYLVHPRHGIFNVVPWRLR